MGRACTVALIFTCLYVSSVLPSVTARQLAQADVHDAELAAAFAAAAAEPSRFEGLLPDNQIRNLSALPCRRPQPHSNLRSYKTPGTTWTLEQKTNTSNAGIWTVQHAPVPNVTAEMFQWMFRNIIKSVKDPRDDRRYPLPLLMHPVDYIRVTWNTRTLTVQDLDLNKPGATVWQWMSSPGTRCTPQFSNTQEPVSCPADRVAFTCRTRPAAFLAARSANVTLRATEINSNVVNLAFLLNVKEAIGIDLTFAFSQLRWSYRYDSKLRALRVTSTRTIGLDLKDALRQDDVNGKLILPLYASKLRPFNWDWRRAAYFDMLTDIEMVGALSQWLPAVYAAANV